MRDAIVSHIPPVISFDGFCAIVIELVKRNYRVGSITIIGPAPRRKAQNAAAGREKEGMSVK
jgi:hypothetical protein